MAAPTKRDRVDFINFIIDATDNEKLAQAFLDIKTAKALDIFFQEKGYVDIPFNDCKDILNASQSMHGRGVDGKGKAKWLLTRRGY